MMCLLDQQRTVKVFYTFKQPSGKFVKTTQPDLDMDSTYEAVSATWSDINNDGNLDLIVVNGVDQYYDEADYGTPRIYLNDGKGKLTKAAEPFYQPQPFSFCYRCSRF